MNSERRGINATHVYIGTKKCGCTVAATADDPGYEKETAEFVSDMIARGMVVERVTIDSGRNMLKACNCNVKTSHPHP